jgi:hypothetical protein
LSRREPSRSIPRHGWPGSTDSFQLAQWLREVGRRRIRPPSAPRPSAEPPPPAPPAAPTLDARRWLLLSLLATLAFLQYFYADAFLQIARLPSIIVFVLVHGQLPPA